MTRRILITGGAGFIGVHLAGELASDAGNEITLLDNFVRGRRDADLDELTSRANVRVVAGDATRPETYEQLGGGYDEVYHLAAIIGVRNVLERPHDVVRVNALSTIHLLDWLIAGGGRKVLFSSTSEAYAWTQKFHTLPIPTPEDVPLSLTDLANPRSSYAGSKIHGELLVTHCCTMASVPFAIVRYHNVYGPRMGFEHVIPELYGRAMDGQNPLVVYSPSHQRAFCYVSDAVRATIAAMRAPGSDGGTFNVGNDRCEVTIRELAERLLAAAGVEAGIREERAANDPIVRRSPDISRARELLGYEPEVGLDEGLRLTLAWYGRERERRAALAPG